jgi:hypothetical protein
MAMAEQVAARGARCSYGFRTTTQICREPIFPKMRDGILRRRAKNVLRNSARTHR